MFFPLDKKVKSTRDPESFRRIDLALETEVPIGAVHPGAFGFSRRNHTHEGVDLYGHAGDPVFAMLDGIVTGIHPFTGPSAGLDWWLDTECVVVESPEGVLIYGELKASPGLKVGASVKAGETLGHLATVLRHDKGRPMTMLHLERYEPGIKVSCGIWEKDCPRPAGLLDPTAWLLEAGGL